jgi:hypothetical protein
MSKRASEQNAVQAATDRVNELAQAREALIADIARLEGERATASVERLRQIAGELRDAHDALPGLDAQIVAARESLAAAQYAERLERIEAMRPKEAAAFGEIVSAVEVLRGRIDALRAVGREIDGLGGQMRAGVPLSLVHALAQFGERVSRPPEVSDRQRRVDDLRANLQRGYRVRAELKRSGARDAAALERRQEVERWIARDEAALRALGEELPADAQRGNGAQPAAGYDMTPEQASDFEQMRQRIAEIQSGGA